MNALGRGMNVAMVFDQIPEEWNGFEVINGDDRNYKITKKTDWGLAEIIARENKK